MVPGFNSPQALGLAVTRWGNTSPTEKAEWTGLFNQQQHRLGRDRIDRVFMTEKLDSKNTEVPCSPYL